VLGYHDLIGETGLPSNISCICYSPITLHSDARVDITASSTMKALDILESFLPSRLGVDGPFDGLFVTH